MSRPVRPKIAKSSKPSAGSVTGDVDREVARRPAVPTARVPPPAAASEALGLFEAGLRALHAHDYRQAAKPLRALLEGFPTEKALGDRARVFLDLCERELAARPAPPKSIEDRLNAATAALNEGHDAEAERLARQVAAEDDHQDLAYYLLAAVSARRGDTRNALFRLSEAIALRPDLKAQALHDEDFVGLRTTEEFRQLTDLGPMPQARRSVQADDDR